MKNKQPSFFDFLHGYLSGQILLLIIIGVTVATTIVFVRTAHAINNHPYEDFMVSDDMTSYMMKQGHLQDFEEGDMQ